MFKIGEFSKLSQVSVNSLRYYDEQELLKPAKIDNETGDYFYNVQQLAVIEKLVLLSKLKFSVAEIAEMLTAGREEALERRIKEKYQQTDNQLRLEESQFWQIEEAIQRIRNEEVENYLVSFKSIPKEVVVSMRKQLPSHTHQGELWASFGRQLEQQKVDILVGVPNNITIFHDESYCDEAIDIEICLKVKSIIEVNEPLHCYEVPELPLVASIFVKGPYEKMAGAYVSFAKWLDANGEFEMLQTTRQIAHRGPCEEMNSENYLTELQIPLKKRS